MITSTANGIVNQNTSWMEESSLKSGVPKYLQYDKRPTLGKPGESWDMYVVRKMREEREYKNNS